MLFNIIIKNQNILWFIIKLFVQDISIDIFMERLICLKDINFERDQNKHRSWYKKYWLKFIY